MNTNSAEIDTLMRDGKMGEMGERERERKDEGERWKTAVDNGGSDDRRLKIEWSGNYDGKFRLNAFESRVGNSFEKKSTMNKKRMSFKRTKEKQLANFKFQLAREKNVAELKEKSQLAKENPKPTKEKQLSQRDLQWGRLSVSALKGPSCK